MFSAHKRISPNRGIFGSNPHSAYAVYFDHKRRSDPEFRKALKRDARRQARMAKEAREVEGKEQQRAIKRAVEEAQEEGFPTDIEEREAFFMKEVAEGEARNGEGRIG
jgi:mitochondrial import receptor subunit TOM20